MNVLNKIGVGCLCIAALVGCGGGGGGDTTSPPDSSTSFPLAAAWQARLKGGSADSMGISGSCTGNANQTTSAAQTSTFEGVAGYSTTQTLTGALTNNCPLTFNATTATNYLDANYWPIGSVITGKEYAVKTQTSSAMPSTVKLHDTAEYATFTLYSDSSKTTVTGKRVLSYVVESDSSSNSVVLNYISKTYDSTAQLKATQQSRYRLKTDSTMTLLGIDIQYTDGTHLIYTKI